MITNNYRLTVKTSIRKYSKGDMEGRELQHFFHEHLLILKAEEHKTNGANDHPEVEISCDGCLLPVSGPFYSCRECRYFLHKLCAELPSSLDHPLHPKHPLTLLPRSSYPNGYGCDFCQKLGSGLVYNCSVCSFDLDIKCAFPTYEIKDTCHPHPLTPVQVPTALACHICQVNEKGLFYKCDVCPFLVHQNCTAEHTDHDHPYPFRVLQHFFHEHPLLLKVEWLKANGGNDHPKAEVKCAGCGIPISGPFYSCGECGYFLHKVCAELPSELDHPQHPQHPLTLLERSPFADSSYYKFFCHLCGSGYSVGESRFLYHCSICASDGSRFEVDMKCAWATQKIKIEWHPHTLTALQFPIAFACHICRKKEEGLSYKCYGCPFWVHQNCTLLADEVEHSHHEDSYPFRELQHVFHKHPLILIANEGKTEDGIGHSNMEIECCGCRKQILGPFYSCGDCRYFLHKVCAELPSALDHPLHPQHPLTLRNFPDFKCSLCRETGFGMIGYACSTCSFYVDMKCASATHVIHDKCHPHPLTPVINLPISFPCNICLVEEKGPSYRCNICPFGVHQNCTLLPNTVKHSYHAHLLKLFPSIPFEFSKVSEYCDICHSKLFMFQCIYGCDRCLFFAHVSCARSETIQSPSTSRDQNIDCQSVVRFPMKQDSTELISEFVKKYIAEDGNIDDKIYHFDHEHPLSLIDEKTNEKTCEVCAIRILAPSYGCLDCDYFLHKCCTDLPKQIRHPLHSDHQLALRSTRRFIRCHCCLQWCNSFSYQCPECEFFGMDIKCASSILQGTVVYHEAHKHPLLPRIKSSSPFCTACGSHIYSGYILECNTCSFVLCFRCAMAPRVIQHRYGKSEPFRLTYSPPENHYEEYLCEICLETLNPKQWYYHCVFADQFAHISCMIYYGADSNIKYGKSHLLKDYHEQHKVTTVSCRYDCTPCSGCRHPMRTECSAGVGLECKPCNFRRHLVCPPSGD